MKKVICILFYLSMCFSFSQNVEKDSLSSTQIIEQNIQKLNKIQFEKPNNPKKAGIYSAILPGLGQIYNKKYWKLPIVWGGIGTGIGIIAWNQRRYTRYRSAFNAELNGQKHEFSDIKGVDKNVLGRTQDSFKRQRDYAIAITAAVYILNILDAVVDAHLYDQKHDQELAIRPVIIHDEFAKQSTKAGLNLSWNF